MCSSKFVGFEVIESIFLVECVAEIVVEIQMPLGFQSSVCFPSCLFFTCRDFKELVQNKALEKRKNDDPLPSASTCYK